MVFQSRIYADYKSDIGYTKLQTELGAAMLTGSGVAVSQIEAEVDPTNANYNYRPDAGNTEFSGKSFTFPSNFGTATGVSTHATTVGRYYYGAITGMSSGIPSIDVYEANSWLKSGFLKLQSTALPASETKAIENHSWAGSFGNSTLDVEDLMRFDYAIVQNNFLAAIGLTNSTTDQIPALMASSYNGIVVGQTVGTHSSGPTVVNGSGRVKPDIVGTANSGDLFTSYITATVASTGAMLIQKARSSTPLKSATNSVVLKALLLAGATKNQFPGWSRTATQPLDAHYGAGQLNIFNSYHILVAGTQTASSSAVRRSRGWNYGSASTSGKYYFFDIAPGNTAPGFSAVLSWNCTITPFSWSNNLTNVWLLLYSGSGFQLGSLIDSSSSSVDNVQHIYQPNLPPGRYALEVVSSSGSVNYGLAWNTVPTVTIAATTPSASEFGPIPGVFTLTRAGETVDPLTVYYTTGGTAVSGSDYNAIAGNVVIPSGTNSTVVTITPVPDALAEGDRTVTLSLNTDLAYSVGSAGSDTVIIHDKPFDGWRYNHFTSSELNVSMTSGPNADPDGDGISNLMEYALNLDPKVPGSSGLPVAAVENGMLTLSYTQVKAATDISYIPEISTDLVTWNQGSGYLSMLQTTGSGTTQTVKVGSLISPSTAPKQFIRLRVTRP